MRQLQKQYGRGLLRELLPPGDWRLSVGAQGRPLVLDGAGQVGPDVSISHSGPWVAGAVAENGRVGIDLETPREGRDWRGIAEAYFSEPERAVVSADGEPALLALWTMREAIAKCRGGGVPDALALNGELVLDGRNSCCSGPDWVVAHRSRGGLHLAVAWSVPTQPPDAGTMLSRLLDSALSQFAPTEKTS